MKKQEAKKKDTKKETADNRLKQLVMAFHPASCRSTHATLPQLRGDFAHNVAA